MGLIENARAIANDVYRCLKANGMKIKEENVYFDYDDFKTYRVKAETDDGIKFDFPISHSHVKSLDGKYAFEIEPFKHEV